MKDNFLKICFLLAPILLELGQRKHTKFYIVCRLYWNSTVKSHFFFLFFNTILNTIFNTFPFLYKFASLGFQMQATDKGGRVGHWTHTVKQAKWVLPVWMPATSMPAHAQPSLLRESCLSPISFFSRREATILLELGQRKHTKFYIACRLYWNSTVKEKKYRSWALKFVYTIGINSTKISNMLFNWQEMSKNITSFFFNSSILWCSR